MTKQEKLLKALSLIKEATALIASLDGNEPQENTILSEAIENLGFDASPNDIVDDEVGCAESVTTIISKVVPDFPVITGTWTLWKRLESDERFVKVITPQAGDIIISPTGTVAHAPFPGHTGIMFDQGIIMSNNSSDGTFTKNYNLKSWVRRWGNAGYPVYVYRYKN